MILAEEMPKKETKICLWTSRKVALIKVDWIKVHFKESVLVSLWIFSNQIYILQ